MYSKVPQGHLCHAELFRHHGNLELLSVSNLQHSLKQVSFRQRFPWLFYMSNQPQPAISVVFSHHLLDTLTDLAAFLLNDHRNCSVLTVLSMLQHSSLWIRQG